MADKPIWPASGYAPGNYSCTCRKCGKHFIGDKRAYECPDCVIQQLHADLANAGAVMVEACARELDAASEARDSQAQDLRDNTPCLTEWHKELIERWRVASQEDRIMSNRLRVLLTTLSPIAAAARVLLADDVAISHMAEAIHDGPLGADDHWFSAATKKGGWCVDVVRVALRAIAEQEGNE